MRMWMIPPRLLCNKHLSGEHVECHMIHQCILRNKNLDGYVKKGLIETRSLEERHDELALEMQNRGWNHKSPLIYEDTIDLGTVSVVLSILELSQRCKECSENIFNDYIPEVLME